MKTTLLYINKRAKMALCRSPYYQISFESVGLSVQEKKFNIDFQDGGHLGLPIRTILATFFFIYKSPPYFQCSSIQLAFLFRRKKLNTYLQRGCLGNHLGFRIRMILAVFDIQVILIIPVKFQLNRSFCSGEQVQNRF